MAYKLVWSPAARDDLHDIVVFIARDNPNRAMSFGYELISETDRLQEFPELGRTVPEYRDDNIREIIFRPYRIVYRVDHDCNGDDERERHVQAQPGRRGDPVRPLAAQDQPRRAPAVAQRAPR